jgi:hypothetical protein
VFSGSAKTVIGVIYLPEAEFAVTISTPGFQATAPAYF